MSCGENCSCNMGSETKIKSVSDNRKFSAETERMRMLFDVLAREFEGERCGGDIWEIAIKELRKITL